MKALEVHQIGGRVQLSTRPVPSPGPQQLLIRITVAGLNPHDQKARDRGLFIADKLPAVLANDVVGRVEEVGSGVSRFKVGDRVVSQANFDHGTKQNGLQEYAVVDADFTAKIPDAISDDEAATLPTNVIAPLVAYFTPERFNFTAPWSGQNEDKSLLIIGGGTNCGKFAVQLAALAGVGNIVTLGGDEKELKSFGAHAILSRSGSEQEIAARIEAAFPNGAEYVLDTVNPQELQHIGIDAVTSGGKFARLVRSGGDLQVERSDYQLLNVFGSSHVVPELSKDFWSRVSEYLTSGHLRPTNFTAVQGLNADKVNEVLDAYRDGKRAVKTHFHIG